MADSKAPTHIAYSRQRIGKTSFVWLEIGQGRLDGDGVFHGLLDRLPIGGFSGHVYFAPIGGPPPEEEPQRPDGAVRPAEQKQCLFLPNMDLE
jgi:hypothetical protein